MRRKFLVYCLILSMLIFPCEKGKAVQKQAISFQIKSISLYEGQKKTVKVKTVKKNRKVVFSSSNKNKATVNSKGRVTAKKAGSVRVYAKIKGTKARAYCTVRIGKYANNIKLISANTVILYKGQTSQIRTSVLPKGVLNDTFTYKVADSSIVNVSGTGKLMAKKSGNTKVEIKSVGITKARKKLAVSVTVHVLGDGTVTQTPTPTFNIPSPDITFTATPTSTATPTETPTNTGEPTATPTSEPKTLQDKVNRISPPPETQLIAETIVVNDNGDISTLYFLNKSYTGSVTIQLNEKNTKQSSSAIEILRFLEKDYLVMTNTAKTIRVSRSKKTNDVWWTITDLELNQQYYLRAWQNDTIYGSPYGLIIIKGDTTKVCKIY